MQPSVLPVGKDVTKRKMFLKSKKERRNWTQKWMYPERLCMVTTGWVCQRRNAEILTAVCCLEQNKAKNNMATRHRWLTL